MLSMVVTAGTTCPSEDTMLWFDCNLTPTIRVCALSVSRSLTFDRRLRIAALLCPICVRSFVLRTGVHENNVVIIYIIFLNK